MQVKYASVIELELGPFYGYISLSFLIRKEEEVNDSKINNGVRSSTTGPKRKIIVCEYKQSVGNRSNKSVDLFKGSRKAISKAKRGID